MKKQSCDNPNCVVLRTKTGMAVLPTNPSEYFQPFYCSNVGEFRRYMSNQESESLPFSMITLHTPCEVELPEKWRFLWSWKVSDYTSYKPETCNNGGDYAFFEQHNIFGRMNAGRLELLDVVRRTTSAEFSYDEVSGSFQSSQMGDALFIDTEDGKYFDYFSLYTQLGHDEGSQEFSLNQFGESITWQLATLGADVEVYDTGDVAGTDFVRNEITTEECNGRFKLLKDFFGWEPSKRR